MTTKIISICILITAIANAGCSDTRLIFQREILTEKLDGEIIIETIDATKYRTSQNLYQINGDSLFMQAFYELDENPSAPFKGTIALSDIISIQSDDII